MLALIIAALTFVAPVQARAVSLSDARVSPDFIYLMQPNSSLTLDHKGRNCPNNVGFSETSAYTGKGGALGPQQWGKHNTFWRDSTGRRVTYNGITFRNHTKKKVLVAGFCDYEREDA